MMQLGFGLGLTMQQSGGGGPAYTLRQQIEGLRAGGITPCGARAGIYKVPGVDASPTGFVYNAGAGSVTIGGTFSGNLSFWDFTGLSLVNQGTIGMITDCKFGEPLRAPSGRLYYIDNYAAGSIDLIEYCTFEGPYTFGGSGTAINCRATGTGVFYAPGNIREIRYNRFLGLTSDTLKIAGSQSVGGQIIKRNYFGPPVNLPNIPADYNSGTSYATGVAVKKAANGYVYISLSAANVGNPLPTGASKTDATAFWQGVDPHADFITTVAAVGNGITISENCMDHTSQPPGYVSPVASMGLTNALRVSRNSGTDYILNRITMANNVVFRNPSEGNSAPIQVADGSQPNFNGPIEFIGNWLAAGGGTPYFHPSSNGWVDVWSNNRDVVSDALITGPTIRTPSVVSAVVMAQSEIDYLFNPGGFYRQITQPTPGNGNLIVFTQTGTGNAPIRTVVNPTTVAAGQVNPSMAAISALLAYTRPGYTFVIGDGCDPGTERSQLYDDTESVRLWTDFTAVVDAIEAEFGSVKTLIECWYDNDGPRIPDFKNQFWPFYFGANGDGSAFALGSNSPQGKPVNHCLWDASAAVGAKGRGIFARDTTSWQIITQTPYADGPVAPTAEATSLAQGLPQEEPCRAVLHGLSANALAITTRLAVGPSAHIADFGGGGHPLVADPDGQIPLSWPFAIALMRAAGMTIGEPVVSGISGPTDGSYADLSIDLPNGGTLTTLRQLRAGAMPGTPSPHQQVATGIEIGRAGGARRPVFRTSETTYDVNYRGTVTITDAGSGSPRKGKVRVTPTTPFGYNDTLSYLRGQATGMLQNPRDAANKLFLDHLIEHVPSLYDASALYPLGGIAVKPFQEDATVLVPAPGFTPRSAYFDRTDYFSQKTGLAVPTGANGMFSMWYRSDDTSWHATSQSMLTFVVGTTDVLALYTASSGRVTVRLNNDTATDTKAFEANGGALHTVGTWYHIVCAWTATGATIYINDALVATFTYASLDMAGANITRVAIGAKEGGPFPWKGDLAHVYVNLNQTLDLSVVGNRRKFISAGGSAVDLGGNGSVVTGTIPEFYFDGVAPSWGNQGSVGAITLVGALTPGAPPP